MNGSLEIEQQPPRKWSLLALEGKTHLFYFFGFLCSQILWVLSLMAVYKQGLWTLAIPGLSLGLAVVDALLGNDTSNPTKAEIENQDSPWYRWPLYLPPLIQIPLTIYAAYLCSTAPLELYERIGLVLTFGFANVNMIINIAHELFHKKDLFERWFGILPLAIVLYMPLYIEHIRIHHVHFGTPKDVTAPLKGDSFWRHFFRCIWGTWVPTWRVETERLAKKGFRTWNLRNQMLWFIVIQLALVIAIGVLWGWQALLFFGLQAFLAILLFETIPYIQHYGLQRKEIAPGKYEAPSLHLSWDCYLRLTNFLFYNLPRHSDHHLHVLRRYQVLETHDKVPMLPYGYITMVFLSFFPKAYRSVIDPILEEFEKRDKGESHDL